MTLLSLGKRVLFVSMAISFALFIGYHLLLARSNEGTEVSLDEMATQAAQNQDWDLDGEPDLTDDESSSSLIWLTSSLARVAFREPRERGDIFAYLSMGRLYGIDEQGRIIALTSEREHQDAPLLSGDGLKVDLKNKRLAGKDFLEAVQFLTELENENPAVQRRISEVCISRKSGIILFFNWTDMIPIIVGHGLINQKVKSVDVFFDQLTNSGLLDNTRYLDVRLGDRIILKRNS
jgi:hypothetical protein